MLVKVKIFDYCGGIDGVNFCDCMVVESCCLIFWWGCYFVWF